MITIHQRYRQTDGQTDRQTTCNRNTALCTKVHRAVKTTYTKHDRLLCTANIYIITIIYMYTLALIGIYIGVEVTPLTCFHQYSEFKQRHGKAK